MAKTPEINPNQTNFLMNIVMIFTPSFNEQKSVWMSPLILTALHYHQGLRAKSLSRVICQGIRYGPAHEPRTPDTLFSQNMPTIPIGYIFRINC